MFGGSLVVYIHIHLKPDMGLMLGCTSEGELCITASLPTASPYTTRFGVQGLGFRVKVGMIKDNLKLTGGGEPGRCVYWALVREE